jgi:FtsH-binding integral membrane protein
MSQDFRQTAQMGGRAAEMAAIDQGLRAHMLKVYNYMAIALVVTAVFAIVLASMAFTDNPAEAVGRLKNGTMLTSLGAMVYTTPLKWVIMLAPLGLVFFLGFRIHSMAAATAQMVFWVYSALVGISLSYIFGIYTSESITQVFFITSAAFAGLSLYGYTTKKSLSGMGSFLMMGLLGIIIAGLVNLFLQSGALAFAINVIGVLVFAGLTAYDTQRIKEMYFEGDDSETHGKKAIMGALSLYLNFINMFMMLLQLFGNRE